ncbi:MAG: glycoside hydrolase family 10 protein [Ruminococcaceae bacterium]|nr:glycoside hydrolase family 10 protein [Oscillospiraceae bacterium]
MQNFSRFLKGSVSDMNKYFYGVWVASVLNLDFPSKPGIPVAQMKEELEDIIATSKKSGLNAVLFQVRPASDALYKSKLFPVSKYLTGVEGSELPEGFDPLDYMVTRCHEEGLELHAWINPYRITLGSADKPNQDLSVLSENHPARQHPEWVVAYPDGKLYFNPGIQAVRDLIVEGVREVVEGYAVDGVHFDDYFYPYPMRTEVDGVSVVIPYDDKKEYEESGNGMSLDDWRRDNVNKLVKQCYDAIHAIRDNCSFGISPFAIWRNKSDACPEGMETNGLECYSALYADFTAWVDGGYIDYINPQIYWKFDTAVARFGVILDWYDKYMEGKNIGLYAGHGLYRCDAEGWEPDEIPNQIDYCKEKKNCNGSVFFGYSKLKENALGLCEVIAKKA